MWRERINEWMGRSGKSKNTTEKSKERANDEPISTLYYSAHYDESTPRWGSREESATGIQCIARAEFTIREDGSEHCRAMYRLFGLTEEDKTRVYSQFKQNMEKLGCDFTFYFMDTDDIMNKAFPVNGSYEEYFF